MQTVLLNRRPALRFILYFCAGILLAHSSSVGPVPLFLAATVLLLFSILASLFGRNVAVRDGSLAVLVVVLGMLLHSLQRYEIGEKKLIPNEENEPVVVLATVDDEPLVRGSQLQLVLSTELVLREEKILQLNLRVLVHGKKVLFEPLLNMLHIGATVRVEATLEEFPQPRNPGDFDYGRYLELNNINGIVQLRDSTALTLVKQGRIHSLRSVVADVRNYLGDIVDNVHSGAEAGFLRGILLADRSNIPKDVNQAFIDTGTVHILSVSGSHVAVVVVILYGFFGLVRLPRKWVAMLSIVGILFYMLLTGSTPPVVRSAIMSVVLLAGLLLERKVDIYQSIAFSALALLLWNTNNLFDVGFQLSYAAVISIIYFYPIFVKLLDRIPARFEEIKMLDTGLKLFAVSLAAQVGTLPFTIYYFERVSVISLLANLVVVPVVGINVMLGFATLAFAPISLWITQCYAILNDWLVAFLLGFVKAAASVPYAYFDTSRFGLSFPVLYYLGVIGLVNLDNRRITKFTLIATLIVVNIFLYSSLFSTHERSLQITMIDVGQGDGILLEFPDGTNVLVDAGPLSMTYDAGERLVAPVLKSKGVDRLDAVILSHPHSDHIGGVPYLLKHFRVAKLLEPSLKGETALYKNLRSTAAERSIPLFAYSAGDVIHLDEQVRLYVLHPIAPADSSTNLNNVSLVVKLVYGSTSLLLTGDAEREVEQKLLNRYEAMLSSDILKSGHHGSNTSSTEEFLWAVHPKTALLSVGLHNKFRHPSPSVLKSLTAQGIEFHRTDKEGALVFVSDGRTWRQVCWRERSL